MAGAGPPGWTLRRKNWHFFGRQKRQDHCLQNKHCQTSGQGHCQTAPKLFKCAEGCVPSALLHLPKRRFDPYGFENRRKNQLQLLSKWFCSNQLCMPTAAHLDLCSRVGKKWKRISNSHICGIYIFNIYTHVVELYSVADSWYTIYVYIYIQLKILMHEWFCFDLLGPIFVRFCAYVFFETLICAPAARHAFRS